MAGLHGLRQPGGAHRADARRGVRRRKWLSDEHFLDLLGAPHLIPGPNSTEMAIHVGYLRAGWPGLIAAGGCFISPAMLIVLGLAWAYVQFGATPQAAWMLYGVKPVIIAVVAQALWELGRKAVKGWLTGLTGAAVTLQLSRATLVDALTVALAVIAAILLFRFKINSTWIVLGGALIGLLRALLA